MTEEYVAPEFELDGFNCPYCNAFSHQIWYENINASRISSSGGYSHYPDSLEQLSLCVCDKCKLISIWVEDEMIYPKSSIAPLPIKDMPEDIKIDFLEARKIVKDSPRSAAALLRVALEKLILNELKVEGHDLNDCIAKLVAKGLPVTLQQAADSLRVIGNEAVHPGELDLKDDVNTAIGLFKLLNKIVEVMIIQPKEISQIYGTLPESKIKGIKDRDNK